MLLVGWLCEMALACEYNNITGLMGAASFRNLISSLSILPKP